MNAAAGTLNTALGGNSGGVWRAPLVPVALAFTAGIVLDRLTALPLSGSLFAAAVMLVSWTVNHFGGKPGLSLVYLAFTLTAAGAAYHHYRRDCHAANDIGWIAGDEPRVIEVRGLLDDEPRKRRQPADDPLRSPRTDKQPQEKWIGILAVRQVHVRDGWNPASGLVQLSVSGTMKDLHAGDEIETAGRLEALPQRQNPGERDQLTELGDEGIRAILRVQHTPDGVVRLAPASWISLTAWRARVRGWGVRTLQDSMPSPQGGLAAALLLGDGTGLSPPEWEKYARTGVIHVLVVSGQQLAILAGVLWFCLRFTPLRKSYSVLLIVLFLWTYALLTGARPSVVRAAATVSVFAAGVIARRPALPANALAAAWLLVLVLNPADVNNLGCLLSFACVAALYWLAERQTAEEPPDPLDQLVESARPAWQAALRGLGRFILMSYAVTLVLSLVTMPLVLSRMHFLPLAGLAIGPPVIWLTSIALVTGFLLLLASALLPPLAPLFAALTSALLAGCERLVDLGVDWWQRQGHVSDLPSWWLIGLYLLLAVPLLAPRRLLPPWRLALLAGLLWLSLGAATLLVRFRPDELRVTFLAVGHGGCTVIETPDGRVLLYDTGSMQGPGVTRFRIAPFLWSRGIRRIDEVFLSHADLDHFNGLIELLNRFPIGQVTHTPSFELKENRAVRHVVTTVEERGVPVRAVKQGDRLRAGSVTLDVLHPPNGGPEGIENVRSLVLLVSHGQHRLLLTGDLEGEGLAALTSQDACQVDVLMAPHHGSRRIQPQELLAWSKPSLIVSCQGPRPKEAEPDPYVIPGVEFLGTWRHGAITVRSHASGLAVETFATRKRFVLRAR